MKPAEFWINHLKLNPHPEGGFYRETYRSEESIIQSGLPRRFNGKRQFSTAIFFLLRSQDRSMFHRIKSDELWHFHAGTALNIYIIKDGKLVIHKLGPDPEKGELLQIVVPANCWFGAKVEQPDNYTLSGCTVAPGFDFEDFELAESKSLVQQFPELRSIIELLT